MNRLIATLLLLPSLAFGAVTNYKINADTTTIMAGDLLQILGRMDADSAAVDTFYGMQSVAAPGLHVVFSNGASIDISRAGIDTLMAGGSDGSSGQVLTTDGNGKVSWATPSSGLNRAQIDSAFADTTLSAKNLTITGLTVQDTTRIDSLTANNAFASNLKAQILAVLGKSTHGDAVGDTFLVNGKAWLVGPVRVGHASTAADSTLSVTGGISATGGLLVGKNIAATATGTWGSGGFQVGGAYPFYISPTTTGSYAVYINPVMDGVSGIAIYATPNFSPSGASNDVVVAPHWYQSANNAGSVKGLYTYGSIATACTLAAHYGVFVGNPAKTGTGVITSNYGIFIENQTIGASNNYALYSTGGTFLSGSGFMVGTASANNNIDDASGGSGSTTLYIGNASINVTSDIRAKDDVTAWDGSALDLLDNAKVIRFKYNKQKIADTGSDFGPSSRGYYLGLSAQDVIKWAPWTVNAGDAGSCPVCQAGEQCEKHTGTWKAEYEHLVPVTIKAVQELRQQNADLAYRVTTLEEKLAGALARLDSLEAR